MEKPVGRVFFFYTRVLCARTWIWKTTTKKERKKGRKNGNLLVCVMLILLVYGEIFTAGFDGKTSNRFACEILQGFVILKRVCRQAGKCSSRAEKFFWRARSSCFPFFHLKTVGIYFPYKRLMSPGVDRSRRGTGE